VKLIRNAARRSNNKGAIGTSVLWAIAERYASGVEGGLDVAGGTTVHTLPNMIKPEMRVKDIRVETLRGPSVTWGKPFPLPEKRCLHCGNPVPLGYAQCGVCGCKMS
jgi:hypothetical protein